MFKIIKNIFKDETKPLIDLEKVRIEKFLNRFSITNYTINDDYSVDVDGDVNLKHIGGIIPIQFNSVSGDFDCSYNQLISLKGVPKLIGGSFNCSWNKITSLEHFPQRVVKDINLNINRLTSLEGCPKEVYGNFSLYDNKITSLEHSPERVYGNFNCSNNNLLTLEFAPEKVVGSFDCSFNDITILELSNIWIGGDLICKNYHNHLSSIDSISKVGGLIYGAENIMTSLPYDYFYKILKIIKHNEEMAKRYMY